MAQINILKLQEAQKEDRLDAEFYKDIPKENPKLKYINFDLFFF